MKRRIWVAALIAAVMFCGCSKSDKKKEKSGMKTAEVTTVTEITEPVVTTPKPVMVQIGNDELYKGNLILVNRNSKYADGSNDHLVNIYSQKSENCDVNSTNMELDAEMLEHINQMIDDFYAQSGINDVLLNSGYRTFDEQDDLYRADLEATGRETSELVAPAGYSEHHTGLAMDFAINDGETYPALKNEGEYSWIYQNAEKYGMILRYTSSNRAVTGYQPESWHFRYVGTVHAEIINRINAAFEGYINFIRDFSYEFPLDYKCRADGKNYKIYFVPKQDGDMTEIPIPYDSNFSSEAPDYVISGNNVDGFIVTLCVDELSEDYNETLLDMFACQSMTAEEMDNARNAAESLAAAVQTDDEDEEENDDESDDE